jgi:uncharacterized BrkB/YihY/UPF0761 family membrane protein
VTSGSLGGFTPTLLYFYITAMILFVGAVVKAARRRRRGARFFKSQA